MINLTEFFFLTFQVIQHGRRNQDASAAGSSVLFSYLVTHLGVLTIKKNHFLYIRSPHRTRIQKISFSTFLFVPLIKHVSQKNVFFSFPN